MTDLASLGIRIDSSEVKQGVGELDKLTAAGGRAEGSVKQLGAEATRAGAQIRGAASNAAAMAAQAQAGARAAVGLSTGLGGVAKSSTLAAYQAQNLAFQINDVVTGIASGQQPMRVFAQQSGQIYQIMQQSGLGVRGFAVALLEMTGILKVTRDAELAEEAANASAAAQAIKGAAQRAAANIAAADTEVALAQAAVRTAATSEELTVAQARLALAHEGVTAAAAEAAIAENALGVAAGRAATAAEASAVATTVALGPVAGVLGGLAAAAGLAFAAFKSFQSEVRDKGTLDRYANSLGLTKKEMKELRQEVGGLSSKEMKDLDERAKAFEITWGDVFNGIKKTASDALDLGPEWSNFKGQAMEALLAPLKLSGNVAVLMYGFFAGSYRSIVQVWSGLPSAFRSLFIAAANAATAPINALILASLSGINTIIEAVNHVAGKRLLDTITPPLIGPLKDNFGKAGKAAGKSFVDNVTDATNETYGAIAKGVATLEANIIGASEKRIKDAANTIIEDRNPKKKKTSDHGLADALAELDAQIRGQLRLAQAYQISDEAAIKAEALQKAEEQAIRHKGDVALFYEKELAVAVAKRAADGGKLINELTGQTAAQKAVNDAVAAGSINAAQASQALENEAQLRPLIAAQAIAEGRAKEILTGVIARLRTEQAAANAEAGRAQVLSAMQSGQDALDRLRAEAQLIGETNAVRAVTIAQLEAEQFLRANPGASADEARKYVETQKEIAQKTADNATAQDNYNNSLSYTADLLGLLSERAQDVGSVLSDAFGGFGDSIGSALGALSNFAAQQAEIEKDRKAAIKAAGGDAAALAKVETLYATKSANARVAATGQVIGSLKGLFKEHSAGYKVMTAIEKAYAIFQAVQSAIAIARDIAHTASSVANSTVRTTANTAEGGSKIFSQLGVWAFPVVAAMVAVLASLGAKGGGGGSSSVPTSADDAQAAQGAGSVLGDSKAKSESIKNSLEIVAANTNKDLEYSNAMLAALRNIDLSISKMAGTVARQIQVSGSLFDTSKLRLGTTGKGGFLGIGASQTTRSLYDLGLILNSASVADIIANGIGGQTYQIVEKIKKKSGFFGIGGGTKTTYQTTNGTIDPEITSAIQSVVMSLRDGLVEASKVIGLDGAAAILDSFQVAIGKVSFKDMTGQEIEDTLNAIFSKVGDQMAEALLPSLKTMQKVGEGLFETFTRVAREYQVVDIELKSLGRTFGAVGVSSIEARDNLVQLFGGLDEFVEATDSFRDQFLTEAEQIAPVQASVIAELQRLGMAGITTREQFKQAVLGLDLTTQAGRDMYASLLAVAPAFDKVLDYFDQANKATIDGLQSTADKFNGFATSLQKYRDTLFATDAATTGAYSALKAKFLTTAGLAASGDATALGGLESAGKDFLTAAKNNASSLQQYRRDVALVAQGVDKGIFAATETADYAQLQLDALKNATTILSTIAQNTAATASALGSTVVATPAGTPTPTTNTAPSPTEQQIVQQNDTLIAQNATIISNLNDMRQMWKRFDGDGLLVRTDEDTPLATVAA